MEKELIHSLTIDFENSAHTTENGVEFWLARDLQNLLGYSKWDNFQGVLSKAKIACEVSGQVITDHFADVGKKVEIGSGVKMEISDLMLTRYACYLIAQNGDPRKKEIAFAQTYFALQTRRMEIIEQKLLEVERVSARKKLAQTEKELSSIIYEQTGSDKNFASIRSKGDKALFSYTTQQMKHVWKVPKKRALADFAPTIILKAKDFATEITIFNAKGKKMETEKEISNEHVTNNKTVRKALLERDIRPESLSPEEDVKKVERKLASDTKKSLQDPETIDVS